MENSPPLLLLQLLKVTKLIKLFRIRSDNKMHPCTELGVITNFQLVVQISNQNQALLVTNSLGLFVSSNQTEGNQ